MLISADLCRMSQAVGSKHNDNDDNDHVDDDNDAAAGGKKRNTSYTTLVNAYYELATLFYEWGWGQSFHFAYQLKGESFKSAIARHEYFLAGKLGVAAGDDILDVGCGIGGPMRNIAKFTRANVTGVTLNEYQVIRGNELNKSAGLFNENKKSDLNELTQKITDISKQSFEQHSADFQWLFPKKTKFIKIIEASHPEPDQNGLLASKKVFEIVGLSIHSCLFLRCLPTKKTASYNSGSGCVVQRIERGPPKS